MPKIKVTIIFMLLLASLTYAYTDPMPTIVISTDSAIVETSATVHVVAHDEGFYAGLESITLREDGKVIASKNCNELLICEMDRTFEHLPKGTHTYSVYAKDRGGNVKIESISIHFNGAFPPPFMSFDENPYLEENMHLLMRIDAYDFNDKLINVTASNLPRGAKFQSNVFEWTPDYNQSGSYGITFTAIDIKNQKISRTLHLDVKDVLLPPVVTVVDPTETNFVMNEDSSMLFRLNIQNHDTKKASIEWLLDGHQVSTSDAFTYKTKFDSAGNHALVARITLGDYLKRIVWNLTIRDVDRPPKMSQIPDKTLKEGQKLRLVIRGTDPDKNDILSYEAITLPTGAKFDPDTGIFEWTANKPGDYEASFRVRDRFGLSAGTSFQITVKEKTDKEKYEELYAQAQAKEKERQAELKNFYEQLKKQVYSGQNTTITPLVNQTFYTKPVCNDGYLCYSTVFFLV